MDRKLIFVDELKEKPSGIQFAEMGWREIHKAVDERTEMVEMVHGHWIEYQVPHIMCCSECDWGTGVQSDFKYCPNCGAKMDGDEE